MGLILTYQEGQTPLDPEQINGLKIKTISTQQQLNEFEQTNINEALQWLNSKRKIKDVLSEEFMIQLHKRMLGMVWKWAGQFRKTETNIGIDWTRISMELRLLVDDTNFWVERQSYMPEEIAIRFKHRLVSIHCFPNGNGRHSRIMADLIALHVFGLNKFSWGNSSLVDSSEQRKMYLKALQLADNGDFSQTLYFVSDRKAEESMTDIYSIERKNGVWMDMKNPLKTINTDGRETTPFITPNGRFLFFSSDALPGMGGYDVYYSENVNGVWGNPVNLGATFNSVNDDTHFQVYPRLKKAVIARINENEGLFNYDIFQIDLNGLDFPFLKD
jgi:Fic-DOC domain mobile mystery protein B